MASTGQLHTLVHTLSKPTYGKKTNKIQSCYYIIALYGAGCVELGWWEF